MKKKGCSRWGCWLGLLALAVVCVAVTSLVYFQARARDFNSKPLVLIHSPVNREQARVGEGIIVHATAREDNGLRRIELWVDNTFVDARDAPDGGAPAMLVFSSSWIARAVGSHVLIVRAIASDGTEGQASVVVEALAQDAADSETHVVEEGETIESIAEEYGITPEELAGANPGLDPGGPAPGDELVIPDDEPHPADGGAPAEPPPGSEPPVPEEGAPGAPGSAFEFPLLELLEAAIFGAGEPTGLRVEFLSAGTSDLLEGLHCYIELGDAPPRWYPDEDNDQTTDESFVLDDTGHWSLDTHLSGESAPLIYWPRNRDLPLDISCVGITAGGTDALDLGRWHGVIPPEQWAGIPLAEGATGSDGSFLVEFRITRTDGGGRGVPLWLDPDMTPPTNIRLDERRISLRWDYNPRPDEEPIDGFRIYLNGSLQWVEPSDSRESMLPYEWFNPPCGTTYTFAVTAYRFGLPDGPESFPGVVILEQPAEDCTREVLITFLTLETFDLGGDGRYEDRHGDVGPAFGHLYANESQITFDGGDLGPGLDMPNGLRHNTVYNLGEMSADPTWRFSGMPALLVAIPDGGTFEFGFRIWDDDSGRCRNSGDPGCDDLICEGLSFIYEEDSVEAWRFDSHNEGALLSEDGRCRVTYQWGPAAGSPVGPGVEGWEPLPWLDLEDFVVNEDNGRVQLHICNTGTATWPWRDLTVELQSREGLSLGVYTWPSFVLEAGQRTMLEHPDMRLSAPFDACVLIDPFDDVLEEYERSGAMFHRPICPHIPDLVITNVRYIPSGGFGQVSVTIRNVGEGALENRAVSVRSYLPDGAPLYIGGSYPNITLGCFETVTLNFGGVSESTREQMRAGYLVTVNPEAAIFESNADNNTYSVRGATRLWLSWVWIVAPYHSRNSVEYSFDAYVVSGDTRRRVADWNVSQDINWGSCSDPYNCVRQFYDNEYDTYWFDIFGDELLEITASAFDGSWIIGSGTETYRPEDGWGAGPLGSYRSCGYLGPGSNPGSHTWLFDYYGGESWNIVFHICREDASP